MTVGRPPIIIVGMHRSGTSLLTRALQRVGFFMGRGTTRNEEAGFTNELNAWMFRHATATWDHPAPMDLVLRDEALLQWITDYVGGAVDGPAAVRFLGLGRWARWRGLSRIAQPWGWKDPRNTFTLPIWLRLFPEARVLHIVRHGVDVAASLQARRQRELDANLARYRRRRSAYLAHPLAPKRRPFAGHQRVAELEGGFALWEAYVDRARAHCAALGERALEIRYEDLVARPAAILEQTADFCGIDTPAEQIRAASARMDAGRGFAFNQQTALREFAHSVDIRLAARGYE